MDKNNESSITNEISVQNKQAITIDTEKIAESIERSAQIKREAIEDASELNARANVVGAIMQARAIDEVAESNYQISQSIKQQMTLYFKGLTKIASVTEQNSKVKEYYMLQKEIEQYEDWLIERNLIKRAYEEIELVKKEKVQISQKDIYLAASIYCGKEAESAIQLSLKNKISLVNYYKRRLFGKRLYFDECKIWVDGEILLNNYNTLGFFGKCRGRLAFITKNAHYYLKSDLEDVLLEEGPFKTGIASSIMEAESLKDYINKANQVITDMISRSIITLGGIKHGYNYDRKQPNEVERIEKENMRNHLLKNAFSLYIIPSERGLQLLLEIINDPNISALEDIDTINSSIENESSLNDLRNLHEQLRLVVRKYKLESAIA